MNVQEALQIASQTHPGMVRSHNEDSVAFDADYGLVVLADGMGGYNAGEVASGIVISVITSEIRQQLENGMLNQKQINGEDVGVALLKNGIRKANAAVYDASHKQQEYSGMGTTVVSGLFYDNRLTVAHIGDSRMYRLRGDAFEALTRDHSLLQEQIDSGIISKENARLSKNRNLVTRAVGIDAEVAADVNIYPVQTGDIYLFCSDGLNDMVEDDEIGSTIQMLQANLPLAANQLVEMANDNGGRDNVSVILVKVNGDFAATPSGWLAKLKSWFF